LLVAEKLLHVVHVSGDASSRRALERFYFDVFAAQTYFEACAVESMPREESMLLIADVCVIPLSPTDLASDEARSLAAFAGRFSQMAIKVPDARATAAHLRAHAITPKYLHPRHETLFFVTDPAETLGVRFEFCAVNIPNDLRLRAGWSPHWWAHHHPLAIQGLSAIVTATDDLARASTFYTEVLGLAPLGQRETVELGAKVGAFRIGAEKPFVIEAWEPSDSRSPVGQYLAEFGGGIYALDFRTGSVDAVVHHLEAMGVRHRRDGPHRVTIDPIDSFGVTLSFVDESPWDLRAPVAAKKG
jgi:catechol 2,3-dioxygenase-like lactoylglutathione lyase family enzyme